MMIVGKPYLRKRGVRLTVSFSKKEKLYLLYAIGYWLKKANNSSDFSAIG